MLGLSRGLKRFPLLGLLSLFKGSVRLALLLCQSVGILLEIKGKGRQTRVLFMQAGDFAILRFVMGNTRFPKLWSIAPGVFDLVRHERSCESLILRKRIVELR
jgi:hypothetical protein